MTFSSFQSDYGVHPSFYPLGIEDLHLGGKVTKKWSWQHTSIQYQS